MVNLFSNVLLWPLCDHRCVVRGLEVASSVTSMTCGESTTCLCRRWTRCRLGKAHPVSCTVRVPPRWRNWLCWRRGQRWDWRPVTYLLYQRWCTYGWLNTLTFFLRCMWWQWRSRKTQSLSLPNQSQVETTKRMRMIWAPMCFHPTASSLWCSRSCPRWAACGWPCCETTLCSLCRLSSPVSCPLTVQDRFFFYQELISIKSIPIHRHLYIKM